MRTMKSNTTFLQPLTGKRFAFTLVELLVAMAITLVLMAALGKAFATIGRSMKQGRSEVTLSSKLRGISFRIRNDLRSRTVDARPPIKSASGRGYITYYEGPLTEHTWALYGADAVRRTDGGDVIASTDATFSTLSRSPTYREHSRFGDIDDYIAFTAEAPGDEWFTGKVPAFLVDDTAADPMEPRVIRSKFAEIITWASPRWAVDNNDLVTAGSTQGMPRYADENNDLIPDQVDLHQRVLLIRPDLNVQGTITGGTAIENFDTNYLRPIGGSGGPANVPTALQQIYPIGNTSGPYYSSYVDAASATNATATLQSHWLVGMAPVHHFFDLSLRRIIHPVTGEPTGYVAANSLNDLVQPHNRFAHVRYPGRYFGRGSFTNGYDYATSMPLLALAWNDSILTWNASDPRDPASAGAPSWFPTAYPFPNTINTNNNQRTPLFNGWLLPHFSLGDPSTPPASPALPESDQWLRSYLAGSDARWDRTGEDIIASNILSFDVKGFDGNAPVFLTSGLDGQPGQSGTNDDGAGASPNDIDRTVIAGAVPNAQVLTELGAVGSDDVLVRMSDIGIGPLMQTSILDARDANLYRAGTKVAPHQQMLASKGDFVDLMYPFLAGGAMEDLVSRSPAPANVPANLGAFCASDFSGYPLGSVQTAAPTPPATDAAITPLRRSGKMVHYGGGGVAFLQPCFDTWTDGYENDGFDQTDRLSGVVGSYPRRFGSVWVLYDPSATFGKQARLPLPPPPTRSAPPQSFSIDTGRFDPADPESSPPFVGDLPAISISVRVSDPATGQISEMTTVQSLID